MCIIKRRTSRLSSGVTYRTRGSQRQLGLCAEDNVRTRLLETPAPSSVPRGKSATEPTAQAGRRLSPGRELHLRPLAGRGVGVGGPVRTTRSWPRTSFGPTSTFHRCVSTGVHGPTGIIILSKSLTPVSRPGTSTARTMPSGRGGKRSAAGSRGASAGPGDVRHAWI